MACNVCHAVDVDLMMISEVDVARFLLLQRPVRSVQPAAADDGHGPVGG